MTTGDYSDLADSMGSSSLGSRETQSWADLSEDHIDSDRGTWSALSEDVH